MAVHLNDLPKEVQRKIKRERKIRMSNDDVKRHSLAVAALLLDERNLSASEARRVFTKAISLLR